MQPGGETRQDGSLHGEVDRLWEQWATATLPAAAVLGRARALLERPHVPASVQITLQALVFSVREECFCSGELAMERVRSC